MGCFIFFLLLLGLAIAVAVYERVVTTRRRRHGDLVLRTQTPLLEQDQLFCPQCTYSLRGLPKNEAGEVSCPECGSTYHVETLRRPCWVGPAAKAPWIRGFSVLPLLVIVLVPIGCIAWFADSFEARIIAGGLTFVLAVLAAAIQHYLSVRFGFKKAAVLAAESGLSIMLALLAVVGGVMAVVVIVQAFLDLPSSPMFLILGAMAAIVAGLAAWAAASVSRQIGRACVKTYVQRVDDGRERFPGLGRYWVLMGEEQSSGAG